MRVEVPLKVWVGGWVGVGVQWEKGRLCGKEVVWRRLQLSAPAGRAFFFIFDAADDAAAGDWRRRVPGHQGGRAHQLDTAHHPLPRPRRLHPSRVHRRHQVQGLGGGG